MWQCFVYVGLLAHRVCVAALVERREDDLSTRHPRNCLRSQIGGRGSYHIAGVYPFQPCLIA